MLAILREVKTFVGCEVFEVQIEDLLGILNTQHSLQLLLLNFESTFSVVIFLDLKISMVFSVEELLLFLESQVSFLVKFFSFGRDGLCLFVVCRQNGPEMVILWFHGVIIIK